MAEEWIANCEHKVTCACGTEFSARYRGAARAGELETDRDCPGCGSRNQVWKASITTAELAEVIRG